MRHTGNYKISAELKTIMKPLVLAMFSASLKFMAKLKVSIYFSVQLKFCIFQCERFWTIHRVVLPSFGTSESGSLEMDQ